MRDQKKDSNSDTYNPGGMAGKSATEPCDPQQSPTADAQDNEQDDEQEKDKP